MDSWVQLLHVDDELRRLERAYAQDPMDPELERRFKAALERVGRQKEVFGYGLVIAGLGVPAKKEAAVKIIQEVRGVSRAEAEDLCRSPVVPVLKQVALWRAEAAAARFVAAKINCRVTSKKPRR